LALPVDETAEKGSQGLIPPTDDQPQLAEHAPQGQDTANEDQNATHAEGDAVRVCDGNP
jgi:hypothetical protein